MVIKRKLLFGLALVAVLVATQSARAQEWELVWSDEFDSDTINTNIWQHEVNGRGGGNNELQYYTDRLENSFVVDGSLVIEAREETFTEGPGTWSYTSARLRTKRQVDWTYGRFEIRAKLPYGQGLWPAIWLLPTDLEYGGWASSGEIDIMELVGHEPDEVHGTLYYGGVAPAQASRGTGFSLENGDFSDDFHVFALEWQPGEIKWFVDDSLYQTQTDWFSASAAFPAPFNRRFHMLLNVAVGGDWPGPPDGSTVFPQRMEVDYVRVYQDPDTSPLVALTAPAAGAEFSSGADVLISADASAAVGGISKVIFEHREGILGEATDEPFQIMVPNVQPGCYEVVARVFDDSGRFAESGPVSFTVDDDCSSGSYLIGVHPIPGRIEAEHYDLGGPGEAYSDKEPRNIGQEMRADEGVDIEFAQDSGGGHNVGWIEADEWLKYTVDVEEAGEYEVWLRVASEQGRDTVTIDLDGQRISGIFNATGGWQSWTNYSLGRLNLAPGIKTMRVEFESREFNLNWINLIRMGDPVATQGESPAGHGLELTVFPNPLSDNSRISLRSNGTTPVSVTVYDALGRIVNNLYSGVAPSGELLLGLDTSDLAAGTYFLYVESGDNTRLEILRKP